jgi:serine phosphatase RsbU (regulator of sigma subunit)
LPDDPAVAAVAPDAVALWLWPEEGGTIASRRTMETLRDSLTDCLPAALPGFDIAAALVPSEPGAALGGDTYDVVDLGNGRWALFVADVAGRGPAAAARAILVRHSARVLVTQHGPGEALTRLSRLLLADTSFSGFVTAFLGVLDTRTHALTFAFAGHEPALVLRGDGDANAIETLVGVGDLPLAVDEAARYEDRTIPFTPRDTLLLYTDGLTDTRRDRDAAFFDEERLREALVRCQGLPAAALVATLLADAAEFAGTHPLRDDTALLAVCGRDARGGDSE